MIALLLGLNLVFFFINAVFAGVGALAGTYTLAAVNLAVATLNGYMVLRLFQMYSAGYD